MRSSIEWNGEGETFGGIVVMRFGMNALNVIDGVKKKLAEISGSPPGVEIVSEYDRSGLIQNKRDLIEASSPAKPSPAVTISQPETRRCQEVDAGRASEAHQSAAIARRAKQAGSEASGLAGTQAVNASAIAGGWPRARYLGSSVRLTRRLPRPFCQG